MRLEFTIPATPVAQPRHRIGVVNGKARAFGAKRDHPIHGFKELARLSALEAHQGEMLIGPLRCDLFFVLPRPKQKIWKTKPMPREWHDKKPDKDNLEKGVLDALSGVLWKDDSQICLGTTVKVIASGDEQPSVRVSVCSELPSLTKGIFTL